MSDTHPVWSSVLGKILIRAHVPLGFCATNVMHSPSSRYEMLSYEEPGPERTFNDDIATHARTSVATDAIARVASRIVSDGGVMIIAFEA